MIDNSELNSSELGTLKYWDDVYVAEIKNFRDHGDVGEVWFGEQTARRVVRWMSTNQSLTKDCSIIDLGCGNGMFLVELAEAGFSNLEGIDYSEHAVTLAKSVAGDKDIKFTVGSILDECKLQSQYDVATDKGTFDAISLDPEDSKTKREQYVRNVHSILNNKGMLILTTCNWTEEEIIQQFSTNFDVIEVLPAPTFQFGGNTGNTVTTVVLRKS